MAPPTAETRRPSGRDSSRRPRLTAVATAVPPVRVDQATAREFARLHFGGRIRNVDRLLPVFDHTGILTRYTSMPIEWFAEPHDLAEKNDAYVESATDLSATAATRALERAGLEPADVDYLLYVNSTGLATPSIDARLINRLGFRRDVRRTPVWGLGCAGGASGLSHAHHHLLGHPEERVLVIATELCTLTWMPNDISKSNLVATALFGDGSGAAVVEGAAARRAVRAGDRRRAARGPANGDGVVDAGLEILATRSTFFPDSLDVMGWNVQTTGLQVVFAQRIPDIVEAHAREDARAFLAEHGLDLPDVSAFLLHPGGTKVLAAYERAYGLTDGALDLSREVLRDYGNMSSATVLFVLERYLERRAAGGGGFGLVSALGPGFSAESLLLGL